MRRLVQSQYTSAALTALLVLLCYWNGLDGDLVHDDIFAIRDNQDLRSDTPLAQVFQDDFWGKPMSSPLSHKSYRPLTVLTFRLNYALHGLEPRGYHVVNVAMHAAATLLFGWVCWKVVFAGEGAGRNALLCALMFAAHPVHTEAVTGIVGRADVLACILSLLAFIGYWSSINEPRLLLHWLKVLLCAVFGGAAMLSKEHGITIFGVCVLYDVFGPSRVAIKRLLAQRTVSLALSHRLVLRLSAMFLSVTALLAFRLWMLGGDLPHFQAQDNPASFSDSILTRALTYCYLFYFNAKLLVYPYTLCFDWQMGSIPLLESAADPRNLATVVFFVFLTSLSVCAVVGKAAHKHTILLGLLLLVLPFLPASNLLLRVGFVVAERILYIPSMGFYILVVQGVVVLGNRLRRRGRGMHGSLFPLSLGLLALVVLFTVRTIERNRVWLSRESLFKSGLETVPNNAKVHFNYANFLKDSGREREAILHYKAAISLSPEHSVSHNNLGTLLPLHEAEHHFREAVKHNPQHYKAYFNLGRNLQDQGRQEEAEWALKESIRINPEYQDSLMSLASLLADSGRSQEGWPYMKAAAEIAPNNTNVLNNLGKLEEAIEAYTKVLHLDPHHSVALASLARVHRRLGDNSKAEKLFKTSLDIEPDPSNAQLLGALYYNTERYAEARDSFAWALQSSTNLNQATRVEIVCNLGNSLVQLGEIPQAVRILEDEAKTSPQAECLHFALAGVFSSPGELKSLEKALEHSSKAVEVSSGDSKAEALHMRGTILKDMRRLKEAEKDYRESVTLLPNKPSFLMNLGAVLHMMQNYPAAHKQYTAALKLDPRNPVLQENLRKLERAENAAKKRNL